MSQATTVGRAYSLTFNSLSSGGVTANRIRARVNGVAVVTRDFNEGTSQTNTAAFIGTGSDVIEFGVVVVANDASSFVQVDDVKVQEVIQPSARARARAKRLVASNSVPW